MTDSSDVAAEEVVDSVLQKMADIETKKKSRRKSECLTYHLEILMA